MNYNNMRKNPYSILNTSKEDKKPLYDPSTKIERYRKGKAPDWSAQASAEPVSVPIQKKQPAKPIELAQLKEAEQLNPEEPQQHISSESSELEFPSEEYLEELESVPLPRPSFRLKDDRSTLQEREAQIKQEEEFQEDLQKLKRQKQANTKELVTHVLNSEKIDSSSESEEESSSDEDTSAAYMQWKVRELHRIIRDREERQKRAKELAEIERRRNLEDWERREEDNKLGTDESAKPEQRKLNFMQKYYHRGVFYQERDEQGKLDPLFMRDYNTPVTGDFDKSFLPKSMQKRRGDIGKKGQSKYTHLCDQDTTDFNPQHAPDPELLFKQQLKSAGFKSMNKF